MKNTLLLHNNFIYSFSFIIFQMLAAYVNAAQQTNIQNITWELKDIYFHSGVIHVFNDNNNLASYELYCDLTDVQSNILQKRVVDPPARIDLVDIDSRYLLIVTCPKGAHSRLIAMIDPYLNIQKPIWQQVGSYYANWEMKENNLSISYDLPCDNDECYGGYKSNKITWNEIKAGLEIE